MLRRYTALITDQGMDTAIPLMDDPQVLEDAKVEAEKEYWQEVYKIYSDFKHQIFEAVFEKKRSIYIDSKTGMVHGIESSYGYNREPESLTGRFEAAQENKTKKIIDAGKSNGAVDPQEYQMFDLRARFAGNVILRPIFAIDENDFKKLRYMSGWHSAFHILDGMITGKTELGRFGGQKKETITILNKMSDPDIKKLKKLRRVFFDKISGNGEDDPDEI